MRINVAIPEAHVDAPPLDAALEAVTRLNESMLAKGEVPTAREAIQREGVLWKPEPPGAEHFDHAATVRQRGWGDCDDLAPWHAASLRHTGEDEGATAIVQPSGPRRWHAVVQRSDGSIDDPSREAGMGRPHGVHGAWLPVMAAPASVSGAYVVRPQIALRPVRGGYQARADMPWHWREHLEDKPTPSDYAMTALHTAPVASTALVGACVGAALLGDAGGFADPEHVDRICCIADACDGMPYEHLAEIYGDEHAHAASSVVGSFFGSIANIAKKAMPIVLSPVETLTRKIPGYAAIRHGVMSHLPMGAQMERALDLGNLAAHGRFGAALRAAPGVALSAVPGPGGAMLRSFVPSFAHAAIEPHAAPPGRAFRCVPFT